MARTFTSYPSPSCPPDQRRLAPPPPHIPYEPPPSPSPPPLPTTPHLPLPSGWTRTHHAIPAAYPRRFADSFGNLTRESTARTIFSQSAGPNGITAGSGVVAETKEERQARNEGEARELLRRRYDSVEWPKRGEGVGEEKGLYMAGERWCRCLTGADADGVKEDGAEGLTMVVTHANGLHKEMWYPTLKRLLAQPIPHDTTFGPSPASETATDTIQSDTSPRKRIDEIWLFDDVHHGASIDLNAGRIGPVHGWSDGGRDIVNFLTHVWKQDAAGDGQAYPEQTLPWRPEEGAGKKRRKVIGIGHSFGGNALVQAAAEQPDLFHALFLVDPMCPAWTPARSTIHMTDLGKWWPLVMGAARRRANWPSIEEAKLLRRSPFFAAWHEEVWDIFLSHGLVPVPPGQAGADDAGEGKGRSVQLATPPWAEAAVFGEPTGLGEGWDRLLDTPEDVKMGFLMANQPKATMGEKMTREMVWRAKGSVNEILPDAGHLAVQERPDRVADALARFIGSLSTAQAADGKQNGPRARL